MMINLGKDIFKSKFNSNDKLCSDNTKEQKDLEAVPFPTLPIHGPLW